MANPSAAWRAGHPWATVYDFLVERESLARVLGRVAFGTDAGLLYDAIDALGELPAGSAVLDIPVGGGVALRGLRPGQGIRYVAADISPEMLARTKRVADERGLSQVEVQSADVENLPFEEGEFDLVQSFAGLHCFPNPRLAVLEIARVVRPGGGLALLWNAHDFGGDPWVRAMGELLDSRRAPGVTPINRKHTGLWKGVFEGSSFEPLQLFQTRHEQRTDVDGLVAHIATWSFVGALEDEPRAALVRDLGELLRREHPSPHDVAIPYRTDVYWTRRL